MLLVVGHLQEPDEESQWELWEPSVVLRVLLSNLLFDSKDFFHRRF